jgi:cob(I)alamin adenosyltransferase
MNEATRAAALVRAAWRYPGAALLHAARTTVRRAERRCGLQLLVQWEAVGTLPALYSESVE